jgi:pimeloyl-ACP methyl ester carboxylesterase
MKLTGKLLTTGLVLSGTLGTLAAVNKFTESQAGELDTMLTGEERRYPWKYGDLFYQVKGDRNAKPLLLIHAISPGASSYQWRKNVDALAGQFRVYTVDLLGFGLSDRPAIDYTAEDYADLISDFVREVIHKPTIVVAHGLSCAYVIADAYRHPEFFERLVLVAPRETLLQETAPGLDKTALKFALRIPILGQSIYNLLTARWAIRNYYDRKNYSNPGLVTEALVEYVFTSAHQSNARFSIASLFGNSLEMDVREQLAHLQVPMITIWGRDEEAALETSDAFKRVNSRIETRILDNCNQQPQDEQASKFNDLVREFAAATVRQ